MNWYCSGLPSESEPDRDQLRGERRGVVAVGWPLVVHLRRLAVRPAHQREQRSAGSGRRARRLGGTGSDRRAGGSRGTGTRRRAGSGRRAGRRRRASCRGAAASRRGPGSRGRARRRPGARRGSSRRGCRPGCGRGTRGGRDRGSRWGRGRRGSAGLAGGRLAARTAQLSYAGDVLLHLGRGEGIQRELAGRLAGGTALRAGHRPRHRRRNLLLPARRSASRLHRHARLGRVPSRHPVRQPHGGGVDPRHGRQRHLPAHRPGAHQHREHHQRQQDNASPAEALSPPPDPGTPGPPQPPRPAVPGSFPPRPEASRRPQAAHSASTRPEENPDKYHQEACMPARS